MTAIGKFHELCRDLCDEAGLQSCALKEDERGCVSTNVAIDCVNVNLSLSAQDGLRYVMARVEFGAVPRERELPAWLALLNMNFLMRSTGSMSFGRDPDGGQAILQCAFLMDEVTGLRLYQRLKEIAALARGWRIDYFLDESGQRQARNAVASIQATHVA